MALIGLTFEELIRTAKDRESFAREIANLHEWRRKTKKKALVICLSLLSGILPTCWFHFGFSVCFFTFIMLSKGFFSKFRFHLSPIYFYFSCNLSCFGGVDHDWERIVNYYLGIVKFLPFGYAHWLPFWKSGFILQSGWNSAVPINWIVWKLLFESCSSMTRNI